MMVCYGNIENYAYNTKMWNDIFDPEIKRHACTVKGPKFLFIPY